MPLVQNPLPAPIILKYISQNQAKGPSLAQKGSVWEAQCGIQSVWVLKSGRPALRSRLSHWSPKILSVVVEQEMKEYIHYLELQDDQLKN